MMIPGVNTYIPQFGNLLKSARILLYLLYPDENRKAERELLTLVHPCILTLYSCFECFLKVRENEEILSKGRELNYNDNEMRMENRAFAFYQILNDKPFDKTSKLYDDYNHFIKLRNLIAHANGEEIDSSNFEFKTNEWISLDSGAVSKKDKNKVAWDSKGTRDNKADKVISFLERRKVIKTESQLRYMGWMTCIENPNVANWSYNLIKEMMIMLSSDEYVEFFEN